MVMIKNMRNTVLLVMLCVATNAHARISDLVREVEQSLGNGYSVASMRKDLENNPEWKAFKAKSYDEQMKQLASETLRGFVAHQFDHDSETFYYRPNFIRYRLAKAATYRHYVAIRLNTLHCSAVNLESSIETFDKLVNKGDKRLSVKEAIAQAFSFTPKDDRLKPYEKDATIALRGSVAAGEPIVLEESTVYERGSDGLWQTVPSKEAMDRVRVELGLAEKPQPVPVLVKK